MNRHRTLALLAVLSLALSLLPLAATATPQQQQSLPKVEPTVLAQLAADRQADFFVWLAEKADLSLAAQLETKEEKGRFVYVTLRATADRTQAPLLRYLDAQGADYQSFYIANKILVRGGNYSLLLGIAGRPDVARITANHAYQLQQPTRGTAPDAHPTAVEPNISFVRADQVWTLGITGTGSVLAGNDTGLDVAHPAIAPHYRGCLNPPACTLWDHNYNWWDATHTFPIIPDDDFGHGTHTTGTMVGDDGGQNQIGLAPGAQTIHCKNMDFWGLGDDRTFTECFQWDLAPWDLNGENPRPDLAPDAVNNSWGYRAGNNPIFEDEIDTLQAAGIAVEASAGNEGGLLGCDTVGSPGDYAQIITTGSVSRSPGVLPGTLSDFSSRGPSNLYPNSYVPDVLAPGEDVRSSIPDGQYDHWSGTSMSGPHVTALIGLLWSAQPALRGQVQLTYWVITSTAVPLTGQNGWNCGGDYVTGPNNDWGYGTIDALAAVQLALGLGGSGTLAGTVTDGASGAPPLYGGTVTAERPDGLEWIARTAVNGHYTLTAPAGTFTLTASAFGYFPATVAGVVVVTDSLTTQDITLTALPTYVVSGTVREASSGAPLPAEVRLLHTPMAPVSTDPATGFYSVTVPSGTYTLHVIAAGYRHDTEYRQVVVDRDQTQDFHLPLHRCILLVDDDQDAPDVDSYYTATLDALGAPYRVWNVARDGNPVAVDILGYPMIFWYTGYPDVDTLNPVNEDAIEAYLGAGGNFFLSSQGYLTEAHLSDFGYYFLHVYSLVNNVGLTTITGTGPYVGLGPYALSYPFGNFSDAPEPEPGAQTAFVGDWGYSGGIAYAGGGQRTVFLAFPFEAVPTLADRVDVLSTTLAFFGGCPAQTGRLAGQVSDADNGAPLAGVGITATPGPFDTTSGPDGHYTLTLPAGTYDVTAQKAGYISQTLNAVVNPDMTTTVDFSLVGTPPAIVVTPAVVSVTLSAGATATVSLAVENAGNRVLAYTLTEAPAVDWLAETPLSGTVAPGAGAVITVSVDAGGLPAGYYTTTLQVASNDPLRPLVPVPVTLTVTCAGMEGADFTWTPLSPTVGSTVHFTASVVSGTAPFSYTWDFRDGSPPFTGGAGNVTHTYTVTGVFTVTLAVTDTCGALVVRHPVVVGAMAYRIYLPLVSREAGGR